jgi:hypothetical protein
MIQSKVIEVRFFYKGKLHMRKVDKMNFYFDNYNYTIYRLQGKTTNYDLLKCGIWWEVNVGNERLDNKLIEALGKAIDAIEPR